MTRLLAAVALVLVAAACTRTSQGAPVAVGTAAPSSSITKTIPTPQADLTEPGIVPTTAPVPACRNPDPPPVSVVASVNDPAAPKITVALPEGWSTTAGSGDVGAKLQGPDGVSATVTITRTALDPAAAFRQYADDAMARSPISSISVLPAELCGFSGQKLIGSWADAPEQAVTFGDRLAHIPSGDAAYLVVVHVEAPAATPGFDPLTSPLLDDFTVDLP